MTSSRMAVSATVVTSTRTTRPVMFVRRSGRRRSLFSTGRRRKSKTLPLGREIPVAVVHRVDLERLGHQGNVELHTHRRVIRLAGLDLVTIDHMPRRHMLDDSKRLLERGETQLQAARGDTIFACQRL